MTADEWVQWGKRVADYLNGRYGRTYMPKDADGWTLGGCAVLADALVRWLGPATEKWTVWVAKYSSANRTKKHASHVVVKIRAADEEFWMDGSGVHQTESHIIYETLAWYDEDEVARIWLEPFKSSDQKGMCTLEGRRIEALVRRLRLKFGTPTMRPVER